MNGVIRSVLALCVLLAVSLARPAAAADWSRFRGPNGTGVSDTTNLPADIGPNANVVWKTPLPPGHSSPVLTDTRMFLTAHTPEKETYKLLVLCLDRKTGRVLWQREVPRLHPGRIQ